jgi:hypothetical protein
MRVTVLVRPKEGILDPQGVKPGSRMPPNSLKPGDLQDLLSWLESLQ